MMRPGAVPLLLAAAFLLLLGASLGAGEAAGLMALSAGGALAGLALLVTVLARWQVHLSRTRLAEYVETDPSPCFISAADGSICHVNRAARAAFGAQAMQALPTAVESHFAESPAVLRRLAERAAATGTAHEDLASRRGFVRLSAQALAHGRMLWRLTAVNARPQMKHMAEAHPLPMLLADDEGRIVFMNAALRKLARRRAARISELLPGLPQSPGAPVELLAAGAVVPVLVAGFDEADGRRAYFLMPAGQPRTARPALPDFEDVPVALIRIGADGAVTGANRLARELVNLPTGQAAQFSELVEGLGREVGDWLADAMAGRVLGRAEVLRATRRQPETFVQVILRQVEEAGSAGLVAVISDATELKTLEAKFVQSQKMQAIGQLAGGVAHDFNNLLTAIAGHCDLLLMRHDRNDPDYADLVQIHQNTNRAASLVGQLLAYSRKQKLKPEVIDLGEALAELTHLLNRLVGERVTLTLSAAPGLRPIRADRRQLEQVLMNLVVNARDAMPMGGEIRLSAVPVRLDAEMRRDRATVAAGDYVAIHVQDEGVGIPTDRLDKIFEPFFTTKRPGEGTGLGLSTAYGIVKQTGGYIFADSTPGAGSRFSLYFTALDPVAVPAAEDAQPPVSRPAAPGARHGDAVILLVEDEAPVRAFAARALRMRGYTVLEAENAEAALDLLCDPDLHVDLFVSDVIMPGMDGPSFVREARKRRPEAGVIFVSGYAEEALSDMQARIPNSVFLPKPFSLGELTETVQAQLT